MLGGSRYMFHSPHWCVLCKKDAESANQANLFLLVPATHGIIMGGQYFCEDGKGVLILGRYSVIAFIHIDRYWNLEGLRDEKVGYL